MLVSAAIAAYDPPAALLPQIAKTAKRVPRSRAEFVDTVVTGVSERGEGRWLVRLTADRRVSPDRHRTGRRRSYVKCVSRQMFGKNAYYENAMIHGAACGGALKFVGVHACPDSQADDEVLNMFVGSISPDCLAARKEKYTYADKLVHKDLAQIASGGGVEGEDAGETLWREHDRVPSTFGDQRGFYFLCDIYISMTDRDDSSLRRTLMVWCHWT